MNIWDLVRLTRDNAQTKAEEQKIRMVDYLLDNHTTEEIWNMSKEWNDKALEISNYLEDNGLHWSDFGISIWTDDMNDDFTNWIIGQGEELYNKIMKGDVKAVADYINDNNIPRNEYCYENLSYAFYESARILGVEW